MLFSSRRHQGSWMLMILIISREDMDTAHVKQTVKNFNKIENKWKTALSQARPFMKNA